MSNWIHKFCIRNIKLEEYFINYFSVNWLYYIYPFYIYVRLYSYMAHWDMYIIHRYTVPEQRNINETYIRHNGIHEECICMIYVYMALTLLFVMCTRGYLILQRQIRTSKTRCDQLCFRAVWWLTEISPRYICTCVRLVQF